MNSSYLPISFLFTVFCNCGFQDIPEQNPEPATTLSVEPVAEEDASPVAETDGRSADSAGEVYPDAPVEDTERAGSPTPTDRYEACAELLEGERCPIQTAQGPRQGVCQFEDGLLLCSRPNS